MVVVEVVAVVSGRDFRTRGRGTYLQNDDRIMKAENIFSKQSKNKTYIPTYILFTNTVKISLLVFSDVEISFVKVFEKMTEIFIHIFQLEG